MFTTNSTSNIYENMVEVCISTLMPQLRNMSTDQLNEILYNESKLDALIQGLPQVRSLPTEKETELAQNKTLAEWNLSQQPRLEQLKQQVKAKYEQASQLAEEVKKSQDQLGSIATERSLETTTNLMQVARSEVDEEADALGRDFFNGLIDYNNFCNEFLKKKTLAHKRDVKASRLEAMARREETGGDSRPVSMPSIPPYPTANNAQYPNIARHSYW